MNVAIIDWGTTNFRVTIFNKAKQKLYCENLNKGILHVENGDFYGFLYNYLKQWINDDIVFLMSGMIGSKNGWVETKYLKCDVTLDCLAENIVQINNIPQKMYIIPGVQILKDNYMDIMRGEEVQVFGSLQEFNYSEATVILPGTHSKWVEVKNKNITNFKSNMTGEVFDILSKHTILSKSIDTKTFHKDSFIKGVEYSLRDGGLLNHIFQTRVQEKILGDKNTYSFLSGVIIGNEIKAMKNSFISKHYVVVGTKDLMKLYKIALGVYGILAQSIDSNLSSCNSMYYIYKKIFL